MKMNVEQWWNDTDRGKLKYWEKRFSNVNLCITYLKGTKLGSKKGVSGDREVTNRHSDGVD
jgi:hypothetical protein